MAREKIMQQWDHWRREIANGNTTSEPRDWFETVLDGIAEDERERILRAILNKRVTPANDRDRVFNAGVDAAWGAAHGA